MLRKNLFAAHIAYINSNNYKTKYDCCGHGAITALSTLIRRRRSNADLLEFFLWIIVIAVVGFIAVNQLTSVRHDNSNSDKSTLPNENHVKDSTRQLSIQLTLQLHESSSDEKKKGDNNAQIKILAESDFTTQFVAPRNLRFSSRSNKSNSITNDESAEPSTFVHASVTRKSLKLVCSAPFPIEFKYVGFGYPNFKVSVEKRVTSEDFVLAMYILTLSFRNDLPQEFESGRYICQAVEMLKTDASFDQYDTGNVSPSHMDLYIPGEMKLLHGSLQNLDDLHDGQADYDISSGLSRINRTTEVIALHHDVVVDGKEIILPCGASDPMNKVSLFIKDSAGFESQLNEAMGGPISYDFAMGFKVPVYIIKNMMKRFRGPNFICRSHHKEGVGEFVFKICLTDETNSQVTPASRTVLVSPNKLSVQKFECESDEPIMIKWLDGPPASVQHKAMALPNGTMMYKVTFIATPSQFPSGGDTVARFQCVRSQDEIIIHTWKWIRNGVTKPFLTRNGKEKKLSCCMNTTTTTAMVPGSLHAPQLLVKTCSTMVECHVKASFQPKIASAGGTKYEHAKSHASNENDEACIGWTVPNDFHAGLVMCNGVNRKSSRGKEENDLEDDDDEPFTGGGKILPVVVKWNDDLVILQNKGMDENGSVLKRLTSIRFQEGNGSLQNASDTSRYVQIECTASSMLFTKGFRWTMHMNSGKIIDNIQRETTWEGEQGIILYKEYYEEQQHRIRGVLQIRTKEFQKPFLSISDEDNSKKGPKFAKLQMTNNIAIVKCEVPLWNDTDIWIPNFTDVRF